MKKTKRITATVLAACMTFTFLPALCAEAAKTDIIIYDRNDFSDTYENKWTAAKNLAEGYSPEVNIKKSGTGEEVLSVGESLIANRNDKMPYVVRMLDGGGVKFSEGKKLIIDVKFKTLTDTTLLGNDGRGVRLQMKFNMEEDCRELSKVTYYDPQKDTTVKYSTGSNHLALWQIASGKIRSFGGKYGTDSAAWQQTAPGKLSTEYNLGDWCSVRTVLDVGNNTVDFYAKNLTTGQEDMVTGESLHFINGDSLKSIAFMNFCPMLDPDFDAAGALGETSIDYLRVIECNGTDEKGNPLGNIRVCVNDEFSQQSANPVPAKGFSDRTAVSYDRDADGTTYMRMKTTAAGSTNETAPYIYFPVNGGEGIEVKQGRKIAIETKVRTDTEVENWTPDVRLQMKYNLPEDSSELADVENPDSEGHSNYKAGYNDCNLWEIAGGGFRVADGYVLNERQTSMRAVDVLHEKDVWYIVRVLLDPIENTADYEITNCRTGIRKSFSGKKLYFPVGDRLKSIAFANFKNAVPNADFDYIKIYEYSDSVEESAMMENDFESFRDPTYSVTDESGFYITSEESKSGLLSACVSGEAYYIPVTVAAGRSYAVAAEWKSNSGGEVALTIDGEALPGETSDDGDWKKTTGTYTAEKSGEVKLSTACTGKYFLDNLYFAEISPTELKLSGPDRICRGESGKYTLSAILEDGTEFPCTETEITSLTAGTGMLFSDGVLSAAADAPLGTVLLKLEAGEYGLEAQKSVEIYEAVESEIIYTDSEGNVLKNGLTKDGAQCAVKLMNNSDSSRTVNVVAGVYDGDSLERIIGAKQTSLSAGASETVELGDVGEIGNSLLRVFCWQDMAPTSVKKEEVKKKVIDEIYVAPWGNDENSGEFDEPLLTLEGARDRLRGAQISDGGATVILRGGEYKRDSAFLLSAQDTGTEKKPIRYQAYKDEKPVFTQGTKLSLAAAEKVTDDEMLKRLPNDEAREHLYVINLSDFGILSIDEADYVGKYTSSVNSWISKLKSEGKDTPDEVPTTPTNEVFFDNSPMTVARYPNSDKWVSVKNKDNIINNGAVPRYWEENMSASSSYVPEEERDINDVFTFKYEDTDPQYMKRWENVQGALMFGFWYHSWATQTVGLAKADAEEGTLTSDIPSYFGLRNDKSNVNDYAKYYVFNLPDEIDEPGEYWFDRENLKLYFYKSEDMTSDKSLYISDVRCSFLEINGAEYVTFDGLEFNIGRKTGIVVNANNVTIKDCTVRNLSQNAMSVVGENNLVTGCKIFNTDGGITITSSAGYGYQNGFKHSNSCVENCVIENFSRRNLVYTNAITLAGVGNTARNNTMSGSYHMAAGISGCDNIFEGNEIYNVCHHATDAAAVYFGRSWTSRGNEIIGNYIHDLHPDPEWAKTYGVNAVFADDNFAGANIFGNTFENIDGYAVKFNGCQDNRIENNVFINCRNRERLDGGAVNIVKTGGSLSRDDSLKSTCIDHVNGLFSAGYFNEEWKNSEFAKETEETINGILVAVSAKMNFVAAISGEEWAENEEENIAKYINRNWHEKYPEIYEHLKYSAGESKNNTFINNILINCDEDKVDTLMQDSQRLVADNTVLDKSVLTDGEPNRDLIENEKLNKLRVSKKDAGTGTVKMPEKEYGVIVSDDCSDISDWKNYNSELGDITLGKDSDGTTYVRLSAKQDTNAGNTNAAMVYNFIDKNIDFSDDELLIIESRFRFSATDESDTSDTGPYLAFRYNMPGNKNVSVKVASGNEQGETEITNYSNGAYDLTLAAMTGGKFAYMNGQAKNNGKYMRVAAMQWLGQEGYNNPLEGKTPWLRVSAGLDMAEKKIYYKFYDNSDTLIAEKEGDLFNYTTDGYLNNLGFATMNGNRGTAEIDVDYVRVTREKK